MTRLRKAVLAILGAIGFVGASCAAYAGLLQVTGNFHPVIDGQVYRSAQPKGADLVAYVQAHGIKTVINLRGAHQGIAWYDEEIKSSRELGLTHIDFGMSSSRIVSSAEAERLVHLMAAAPKPILIHCQAGADRSGLASALFLRKIAGFDEAKAEGQLSFYYGHVGIPVVSRAYAMDRSWEDIEAQDRQQAKADLVTGVAVR